MLAFLILAGVATAVAAPALMSGPEAGSDDVDHADHTPPEASEDERGTGDLLSILAEADREPDSLAAVEGEDVSAEVDAADAEDAPEPAVSEPAEEMALAPLQPEPGDAPDLPPDDAVQAPVLAPADPDAPDLPPDDLVDTPVLAPTPGDAPEEPPELLGPADEPVLETQARLDHEEAPAEEEEGGQDTPLRVEDLQVGRDTLRLTLETSLPPEDVVVDVRPSADGTDGVVTVNGSVVAIVEGAPDLRPEDIEVELEAPRKTG